MALRLVPDDTRIPFMWLARFGLPFSVLTMVLSLVAFLVMGLNLGIDFKGGTLVEVQSTAPEADLGDLRAKLESLELGDVEVQGIGNPRDVLIRIATQPGGDAAQQAAVQRVQATLGAEDYTYRRVEVVGPRVSGELAWSGSLSLIATVVGILLYIWFRFEWQFGIAAVATLVHDVLVTIGFFAVLQIDFQPYQHRGDPDHSRLFAQRHRRSVRSRAGDSPAVQTPFDERVFDLATNQTLARTVMTSLPR
jgi:preprotein translocase subunit SecF